MDDDIVWKNTVDGGQWAVEVRRIDEARGTLRVLKLPERDLIHQERVTLAYGAIFGPDMDDVVIWEMTSLRVIDNPEDRVIEAL